MRHDRRWTGVLALAAMCAGGGAPALAQPSGTPAPGGGAEVILARPPVEILTGGQAQARPVVRGSRLAAGDRVRTGKGGATEIRLGDGSLVRLGELSDLEIDRLDVDAGGQPVTSRFSLAAGQARAWVARQVVARVSTGQGRFAVQTATAVAAVRQTDFVVRQGDGGVTRVYTFAGAVQSERRAVAGTAVVCTRNRWTLVDPARDPLPCRVIPLRERRDLLRDLAFEAVHVDPGNVDRETAGLLADKLVGEKMAGDWAFGGGAAFSGGRPADPPAQGVGTANVTVTVR